MIEEHWLPALKSYAPELIIVSAGFDGHKDDPMAELNLLDSDYNWLGCLIDGIAATRNTPVLSILEGGYRPAVKLARFIFTIPVTLWSAKLTVCHRKPQRYARFSRLQMA